MSHTISSSASDTFHYSNSHWAIVTVRIAWALVQHSSPFEGHTLKAAREHTLRSLPTNCSLQAAGRYAEAYLNEYLERCSGRYQPSSFDEDIDIEIPLQWRQELESVTSKSIRLILRYFYARNRSMASISKQKLIPIERLTRAQVELRRQIKKRARVDGLDTTGWSDTRIDRLLTRTARLPNPHYIEPEALLSSTSKQQVMTCPLYSQAYMLIQQGVLAVDDLVVQPFLSDDDTEILAVVLHPEGRKFQAQIHKAMGSAAIATTQYEWLIDSEFLHVVEHNLGIQTELNTPPRHLLRGALSGGNARWGDRAILGPLPTRVLEAARAQAWGNVDGIGELPPALPPPPNARRWWATSIVLAVVLLLSIGYAISVTPSETRYPIQSDSEYTSGTVFLRFDVHDQAALTLVAFEHGVLSLRKQLNPSDKASWSTGDGRYFVEGKAERLILISSTAVLTDIPILLEAAQADDYPIDTLQHLLLSSYPEADVAISMAPPPSPAVTDAQIAPN